MRRGWASSPIGFGRRVALAAYEDNVLFLASALTFDALVAAVPLVLLLLGVSGYVFHRGDAGVAEVHVLLQRFLPAHGEGAGDPLAQAERLIARIFESRARLSIYGIPLFVWFATRLFGGVRAALNEVFDTEETRGWLVGKGLDFVLVLLTLALLVANALLIAPAVTGEWWGRVGASAGGFLLGAALFFVVYTVAPSRPVRWDTALVASAVCALAFEAAKKLFAFYLARFVTIDRLLSDANAVAVLLFVAWVYYTACVFLIGGEVAETYDLMRRQREQRALLT